MSSSLKYPPQSYCAAPWVESIVYANGDLMTCCLSVSILGNWQKEGLANAWNSERYQNFRKKIINGEFPEDHCRRCYSNKYNRNLAWSLGTPFNTYLAELNSFFQIEYPKISALATLFNELPNPAITQKWQHIILNFETTINRLRISRSDIPLSIQIALHKLLTISTITRSFFEQSLAPPIIAPYREVQLISRCNARCIQCLANQTGAREDATLDEEYIPEAFSTPEDIINFFHNGSEFLFYKKWKDIAAMLGNAGVKISLSTNSILLTPTNIKHLIDNRQLFAVNVSIDGATKKTVEAIRVNVNFDHMMNNLNFLCEYAAHADYAFPIAFSFVLMKENFRELPELVRLVARFNQKYEKFQFSIAIQMLSLNDIAGYREFIRTQHPSLVDREEFCRVFKETLAESKNLEIPVSFLGTTLENFVDQGCPLPVLLDPLKLLEYGEITFDRLQVKIDAGWHDVEINPIPARWITKNASVLIHSDEPSDKRVHITICSFHKPRRCQVIFNSKKILHREIQLEPEVISMDISILNGKNELQIISLDGDEAPNMIHTLNSADNRQLAFHIRSFEID